MKTKILVVLAAIALVFALVFTACDNGGGGRGPGSQTPGGDDYDGTPGLAFERITNGENAGTWRVRKGTIISGNVVIPAYYNGSTGRAARSAEDGDPVTEIGFKDDADGNGAFSGTDITEIIIPDTIKSIGLYAFQDCQNLTSITIPASVVWIGGYVFRENRNLKSIIVEAGSPYYIAEDGILYDISVKWDDFADKEWEKKILHSYPSASGNITIPADVNIGGAAFYGTNITSVTIPEGVERIEYHAFANCTSLKSVTIPASVKCISQQAFGECASLISITIAAGNSYYSSEGGILYETNNPYSVNVKEYNITDKVLIDWPSAKGNITIPEGITCIGGGAFAWNTNLTGVIIPDGVMYIGNVAFLLCVGIKSITIPASVTKVGYGAFFYWTSTQTINVQGKADRAATITAGWDDEWDLGCNATINYNAQ